MVIKINYTSSDIYVSTNVSPVYVVVNYSAVNNAGGNFVPYTGATANVNLGEYELKAGQLTLDTSPTGTAAVGTTRWNDTIGSSETTLKGGSVILKNGVDLVARVVNKVSPNTTLTKAAYQAVKISGAQGQRLAISLAQANNDAGSADTIGLVTETIATNQEGFIMTVGNLEGINTTGSLQSETWADGDVLYLSPTTAGRLTNIKPNGSTGHIVVIGYVEYAHANNGKIYVKIMNGWELDELHNVYISSVANNDALIYESSTSLWKNKTIATALGYTPVPTTRTLTINGTAYDLSADRSWTVSSAANTIYTADGTLSGNRIVTMGSNTLTFEKDVIVNGLRIGKGLGQVASNVSLGTNFGSSTTGTHNYSFGLGNLSALTTGSRNTAIGIGINVSLTTGWGNIGIGFQPLASNSGQNNIAIGNEALIFKTSGDSNIVIGKDAGRFITNGSTIVTTANTSILIGSDTKPLGDNQSNQIIIGHSTIGLGSNTTIIGNGSTITTAIYGRLLLGTTTDSGLYQLDVNGTARVSGAMTVTGNFTNTAGVTITKNINMETDGTTAGRIEYAVSGGNLINIGRFSPSSGTGTARPFYVLWRTPDYGSTAQRVMTLFTDNGIMFRDEVAAAYGNPTQTTSAFIEMVSTTRGFLPPRMTTSEKTAISSPAAGLQVYDTTLNQMSYYNGTTWVNF